MNNLVQTFQSGFAELKIGAQKNSPEILTGLGIAGVIGGVFLACKATLKADEIIEEHKKEMEKVHEASVEDPKHYTVQDEQKDTVLIYAQTAVKFVRLYAPSALLISGALFAFVRSNVILKQRYMGAVAALTSLQELFSQYRKRVVDEYGEDVDKHLYYNTKVEEIETEVTDEKGKTKKKKEKVEVDDPNNDSMYVKYFTPSNEYWDSNPQYCEFLFNSILRRWNDRLITDHDVVLNDVYDSLGFKRTQAGMVCGWHYDKKAPSGDNVIKFDIKEVKIPNDNGELIRAYRIDFNVDGKIQELFGTTDPSKKLAFVA